MGALLLTRTISKVIARGPGVARKPRRRLGLSAFTRLRNRALARRLALTAMDGERQSPQTSLSDGRLASRAQAIGAGVQALDGAVDGAQRRGANIDEHDVQIRGVDVVGRTRLGRGFAVFPNPRPADLKIF